uniref:Uracil phosphoribosyltransferase homolog n=1 Tax=Sus scrofa TaxID=9823 RepID=A0A8D1U4K6_PIG
MATELRCPDSMPCHNQQVNSASTPSLEPQQPGDLMPDHAGANSDSTAKQTLLSVHAHSIVTAERDPKACGSASFNSESNGGNYDASASDSLLGDCELFRQIGAQLKLLRKGGGGSLKRLVVEEGLNQLPYKECMVTTPTGYKYEGVKFEKGNCGVSIMRSGEAMEQGLRDCCRSIRIGKILIQSDEETQRAKVYYAKFPPDIYRRKVLLMYPILSTGNTVIEAVKVLIEHGVQPSVIILLSLFSTPHGAKSIIQEFPEITILTTEVHPVAPTHFGQKYFGTD